MDTEEIKKVATGNQKKAVMINGKLYQPGQWRPGTSGNPSGGVKKKQFRDYFDEEEEEDLINRVKQVLKKRPEILKMAIEHMFGKPRQNIGLDGGEGKPIIVNISKEIADKNGINNPNPEASGDSKGQAQV
jgi:hypothetical protein